MKQLAAITLVAASLLGSALTASAQTPAAGPGAGGAATVGSDVRANETIRTNRESGVTTGSVSNGAVATEQPGVVPPSPTGAPVPNAAVSKPPGDAAAPAGR